jgi:hypothetical protein
MHSNNHNQNSSIASSHQIFQKCQNFLIFCVGIIYFLKNLMGTRNKSNYFPFIHIYQPTRSELVPEDLSWENYSEFVEDTIYSIGENITVRFENIDFTHDGCDDEDLLVFSILKGIEI